MGEGVQRVIVAGLPRTGTSLFVSKLNGNLPVDQYFNEYNTFESVSIEVINHILDYAKKNGYSDYGLVNRLKNEARFAFDYAFKRDGYLWKTTALQQHYRFWFDFLSENDLLPDKVFIIVRDIHNMIASIKKRYDKTDYQIKTELEVGFSNIRKLTELYNYQVIYIDKWIDTVDFDKGMLTTGADHSGLVNRIDKTDYLHLLGLSNV